MQKWNEFEIKDVFITEYKGNKLQMPTGAYVHKDKLLCGLTPRITVTSQNNGIDSFCTSNDKNYRAFRNFISVSFLGTVFYHPYEASLDMKVHCLKPRGRELNYYVSMFLISEIKKSIETASYGNQLSSTDLPHKKIMLPIDDEGTPDYSYMEQYIREREEIKRAEYVEYCSHKIAISEDVNSIFLNRKKCLPFRIVDIFDCRRGNQSKMSGLSDGELPLVSAKNVNNGLKGFARCNGKKRYRAGSISLNNDGDGGVGIAYYQPSEYLLDSHCTSLIQKREMSKEVKLYICACIVKQRSLFSHGRSISEERLKMMTVMLPADNDGNPDYDYMESYAKHIIKQKYSSYLEFCSRLRG